MRLCLFVVCFSVLALLCKCLEDIIQDAICAMYCIFWICKQKKVNYKKKKKIKEQGIEDKRSKGGADETKFAAEEESVYTQQL